MFIAVIYELKEKTNEVLLCVYGHKVVVTDIERLLC